MHFINEYEMTRGRYNKWAVPKFWCLPVFYVYLAIFILSVGSWVYFNQHDVAQKWRTLCAFMCLISVYRGVAFKYMATDKQYRLTKMQVFKDKPWMCKIDVTEGGIKVGANKNKPSHIKWERVEKFVEGKSYFDFKVTTSLGSDQARLDKNCFTLGDAESFKQFVLEQHPEIPYEWAEKKWDC